MSNPKSSRPSKQRKWLKEMKLHERKKKVTCHLSKSLKKELGKRSIEAKKGDKAKIMRGKHKKFEGKIIKINKKKGKIFLEKLLRRTASGIEKPIAIDASKIMLTEVDKKDERRFKKRKAKKEEKKRVNE